MPYASDKAKKAAEEALNRLSAELEAGKSEALRNYLATMSRFRRYSWNNVLLISSQRPEATRVAGFHTWHDLGRAVKKGEKGIMIFAPVVVKREASPDQIQVKERDPKEPSRVAGFRTAYVFDVSQTEGKALPEFAKTTGDPKDYTNKLKALAAQRGIAVEYDPSIAPAMGVSSGGHIRLVPDLPKGEEFAVLVHELAHEMLHKIKEAQPLPKMVRETQAEAVAYVVSRGIGLETNTAAADYIALCNGDKATLAKSLSAIQETSAKILDELLPEERFAPSQAELLTRQTESPTPTQAQGQPSQPPEPGAHQQPATETPEPVDWNR
jgi:antirestriction protein ArdC